MHVPNYITQVPVEELVNGLVSHLPLKEDLEEYELVFKAFLTHYSAGHSVTPQCIPKIVESAPHFTTAHNVDKHEGKCSTHYNLRAMGFPSPKNRTFVGFSCLRKSEC